MKNRNAFLKALTIGLICICYTNAQSEVTFEDLGLGNPGSDGSTEYGSTGTYFWNGSDESGSYTSSGGSYNATFDNNHNTTFGSWDGFAYSNTVDITTAGFGNQYSAITGGGVAGSANYGVSFGAGAEFTFDIAQNFAGRGLYATNTTYAFLSMQDGDTFAKKFGGASGNDPDEFILTINGWSGGTSGTLTGSVDFHLADFRFSDNSQDYIVDSWEFVDLTALGTVDAISFDYTSTNTGGFGINTPTYVAIDNVGAVPEPTTFLLTALGLFSLLFVKGRNSSFLRKL